MGISKVLAGCFLWQERPPEEDGRWRSTCTYQVHNQFSVLLNSFPSDCKVFVCPSKHRKLHGQYNPYAAVIYIYLSLSTDNFVSNSFVSCYFHYYAGIQDLMKFTLFRPHHSTNPESGGHVLVNSRCKLSVLMQSGTFMCSFDVNYPRVKSLATPICHA